MIIVEYCPLGNLQHFLVKHRCSFIDQIMHETDVIDNNPYGNSISNDDDQSIDGGHCNAYIPHGDCTSNETYTPNAETVPPQPNGDLIRNICYCLRFNINANVVLNRRN